MKSNETTNRVCRNFFKDGKSTTSREQFTRKWIEMVNQIERAFCCNMRTGSSLFFPQRRWDNEDSNLLSTV